MGCRCRCHQEFRLSDDICVGCSCVLENRAQVYQHELKQETITIKKALWDEMLQYKKRVAEIQLYLGKMEIEQNFNLIYERIQELENEIRILNPGSGI